MQIETLADHTIADTTARYVIDRDSGQVGLQLFPSAMKGDLTANRTGLRGLPYIDAIPDAGDPPAYVVDPLVHVKLVGDAYPGGFSQGRTMRQSASNNRFRFISQSVEHDGDTSTILTTLESDHGLTLAHRLIWHDGDHAFHIQTSIHNQSNQPVTMEMLTSFSLSGITPFDPADAPGRLQVHRYRSVWSAEGRLETSSPEAMHLERSWSGAGAFSERFGQVGSMPVRGWFPFVAVTDTKAEVTWGAQLAWAGSWQMEVYRKHDDLCLSGGLADREFGHWMKTLATGESLIAPPAFLACVRGGVDEVCDRLTALHQRAVDQQPKVEHDLPVVFNEWCTTWGDPQHDKVIAIADRLKDSGVRYLVIDAGWYKPDDQVSGNWFNAHGDWNPSNKLFPDGLKATADAIRQRGLIPGLWFEMETVGEASKAWHMTDHLLKRDGLPITSFQRRFWDLNDPFVIDYLSDKVIHQLRDGGFGYLKVDYNETIGLGADDCDSLGEGLRKQIEGVHRFFEKIRTELPDLVIENCSSGGHRLEPSMICRTAMSSFSDAHELVEIPLIAANLHALMLPRQSQIWAVLHPMDHDRRLNYLLTGTFLGRMCLSGDIAGLNAAQWSQVQHAIDLYQQVAPIIKHGKTRRFGKWGASWRYPTGYQAVVRTHDSGEEVLIVLHSFSNAPKHAEVPLPDGSWQLCQYHPQTADVKLSARSLTWIPEGDFAGAAIHLKGKPE